MAISGVLHEKTITMAIYLALLDLLHQFAIRLVLVGHATCGHHVEGDSAAPNISLQGDASAETFGGNIEEGALGLLLLWQ